MEQYICIHGHFYQPPRENPWLETIELQDSAYPYHDWNERVTAECYAPNTAARILGKKGLISRIVNNYTSISFNFGPTLLAWLENNATEVYRGIVEADQASRRRFSGHGSALAQAYNHMILPLANQRDKFTQVLWGIRDFEHRFGRKPEGMWLPEAAVDMATLGVMAAQGLCFTILSSHQVQRVRTLPGKKWEDASCGKIDTTMPYRVSLPSGQSIAVFFNNDPIARAVAFEGLLNNGEQFARRLASGFQKTHTRPQLVHIATDGETYGHHHRYGDMALAYVLQYIESNNLARITNYGEYLEKHPPTHEVEIKENTSWSCAHGIERWRSNCGCSSGAHPGWNQTWRAPLREALDWLRDKITPAYEERARTLLKDPWVARDEYIQVVLDRSLPNIERFLAEHATRNLSEAERVTALKLLESQRQAMLMYTSDGWFFDELSGIETIQIMQYAARAVQLAQELFGDATEPRFLEILAQAQSNITDLGNGRRVWEQFVKPAVLDLPRVAAHFAISSLFEKHEEHVRIAEYDLDIGQSQSFTSGNSKLVMGRARVTSGVTREYADLAYGVLQSAKRKVNAGVSQYHSEEAYQGMVRELSETFSRADFPEVIRSLDKHFGGSTFSLSSIFRDAQRRVLDRILETALVDIQATYRQLYADYYPPMRFLTELGKPIPAFHAAAELILNIELRRALSADTPDLEYVNDIMDRVKSWKIELDTAILGYRFRQTLDRIADMFAANPEDISLMANLVTSVSLARSLPFGVELWKVQNVYYQMLSTTRAEFQRKAQLEDGGAVKWLNQFLTLGAQLSIEVQ